MTQSSNGGKPQNPNEHLVIPKWINEEYFQTILEQDVPDYVHVKNFTPVAATAPGENYTSIMVRVVIDLELKDGSEKQVSYILKTELESGEGAKLVSNISLFPKELKMYQEYIPRFTRLYKEAGIDIKLAPKCLHVEHTPERICLVLEDLKRDKFQNIDRLKGFDMAHIRQVLHRLAELHAASAVSFEQFGPFDELYNKSIYDESNREMFKAIGEIRQQQFFKAMREWGLEDVESYIEKSPSIMKMFDAAFALNKVDPNEFNVLNHGDCWSNNIMFNYKENGEINDTIFVDLQVGKWGSPAQDLWYMITTSASLDIKVKEFDHFVQIYHKRLVECLTLLKYTKHIPSLKELHIMMYKYGYWGPLVANGVMVAVLYPSDKESNMSNFFKHGPEADAFRFKQFTNPFYVKAMLQLMPFFRNKGLLITK